MNIVRRGMVRWAATLHFLLALFLLCTGCKEDPAGPSPAVADTTSNDFAWTFDTVGAQGMLFDVAIVNETTAIAVGNFYLRDSTGQLDPILYNAAVWNGAQWSPLRLYHGNLTGSIHSAFALDEHNVWLDPWFHWDGHDFQQVAIDSMFYGVYIYRMWGNATDLYAVGSKGFIARHTSGAWQRVPSGTSLEIVNIWGSMNASTGVPEILCVANNLGAGLLAAIIKIEGSTSTLLPIAPIALPLSTVWFVPGEEYYVAGSGMYGKHLLTDGAWTRVASDIPQYYISSIRGNSANDGYAVGAYGEVLHYNGARWLSFRNVTALSNGVFGSVAVKGRLVIAVGSNGAQAIILRGMRQ